MKKKPVIGITSSYIKDFRNVEGIYIQNDYHDVIVRSGGLPIVLPITNPENAKELLSLCDGIILSGGEDIDPHFYNEDPHQKLGFLYPERDRVEIEIIKEALNKGIPLFGVCRGMQILNVALGGTLYQDIPSQKENSIQHIQTISRANTFHTITIEEESYLSSLIQEKKLRVNSFHHQAIKKVAPDLKAVAFAADGIVESIEYKGDSFALGIQWHPESFYDWYPFIPKLFQEFMEKCNKKQFI